MALCRFCATTYTLASSVRRTISGSASVSIFRLASGSAAPKSFATSRPQRAGRSLHSSACNFREQPQSTSSFPPASANDATAPPPRPVAFAFDIDGVLKSGPVVLPAAKRALKLLDGGNHLGVRVPTIYITNGGGYAEERRAELLSEELGVEVRAGVRCRLVGFYVPSLGLLNLDAHVTTLPAHL